MSSYHYEATPLPHPNTDKYTKNTQSSTFLLPQAFPNPPLFHQKITINLFTQSRDLNCLSRYLLLAPLIPGAVAKQRTEK